MFCATCGKKNEKEAQNCEYCKATLAVKILALPEQAKATSREDLYKTNLSMPSTNSTILPSSAYETTEIPAARAQELLTDSEKKKTNQEKKAIQNKEKDVKPQERNNWQLNLHVQWVLLVLSLAISSVFIFFSSKEVFGLIHYPDSFVEHFLFLQITGFTALGVILLQMLLSVKKRLKILKNLDFNNLRGIHIISGLFLLVIIIIHTGMHWKWNVNGYLLIMCLLTVNQGILGNTLETRLTKRMILRQLAKKYKGNTGPIEEERVTKAVLAYLDKTSRNQEITQQKAKEQATQLLQDVIGKATDLRLMWAEMRLKKELKRKRNGPEEGALTTQLSKLAASRFWAQISKNKRPTPVQLMKILWFGMHIIFVSSFLVLLFFHILSVYYF